VKGRGGVVVGALALLLVTALWWTIVAGPTRSELADARDDLAAAEADAATIAAVAAQAAPVEPVDGDVPTEGEIAAEQAALAAAVPAEVDLAGLLRVVGEAAAAEGMVLGSITPGQIEASTTGGPSLVPVDVQLLGPLDALVRFLAALRAEDRVVVIDRLVVAPVDPTTSNPDLDVSLGLRAFVGTPSDGAATFAGDPTTDDAAAVDGLALEDG
jgi:Tfp pilus assembly protein PilO